MAEIFDPKDDDYIIELFKKRCPHIKSEGGKEEKKKKDEKESEIEKIFNSGESVKYEREDIFFSEFDDDEDELQYSDEEEDEKKDEKKKKDDKKKDDKKEAEEKMKKINLLKFCKLSNPSLKGGKYTRTAYQDQFRTLLNHEYLSDVVFLAKTFEKKEWKKIYGHKLILKTRSEYFKKMFETPLKESEQQEIRIENVSYEILLCLIEYLYTGVLTVTYQNALLLLAAANQFLMKDVKEVISEYFKQVIDSDIACMLYEESFFHNAKELRTLCLSYIEANSNKVVFSDAFKQMTPDMVKEIIRSDYLSVDEFKLFEGLLEWAKAQVEIEKSFKKKKDEEEKVDFKKYLDQVIEFVRFPLMKPVDLRDKIEKKYPNLVPPEYIMESYRYHAIGNVSSPRTRPRLTIDHFTWDNAKKSSYIRLDGEQLSVTTTYTATKSVTIVGKVVWTEGLHYWEITIQNCPARSDIQIGVTDKTCVNVESYLAYNRRGWAIFAANGNKYHNSRSFPYYNTGLKKGDKVGVLLNLMEKKLGFFINGKYTGEAFKDVTGPVSPSISLYHPTEKIKLDTHARPSKIS